MPLFNPASNTTQNVLTKTTTYTAAIGDDVILVTTAASWTLTLYPAAGNSGRIITIKKTSSDTNTLTIDANASETIDGALTTTMHTRYETLKLICDGSNWHILERKYDQNPQAFTLAITASTTNPTKGTTSTDQAFWTREGKYMRISYNYVQTAAGTAGAGYYIYNMPTGYTIDTAFATTNNNVNQVGIASAYNGVTFVKGPVEIISANGFVITGLSDVSAPSQVGSAFYQLDGANIHYGFTAKVPITEWKGN